MVQQWPHIVKDWRNIELDGEALPYSPKTVVDLASNPQYKDFFITLEDIAKDQANYRHTSAEELGKS